MNAAFADPEPYAWLITRRNVNWAKWIDERLAPPGTVWIRRVLLLSWSLTTLVREKEQVKAAAYRS